MFHASAYLSYVLLTAFTPGPNNIMAMANAGKNGFKKGFPLCFGIFLGFLVVLTLCAVFSLAFFRFIPSIAKAMEILGAAYILWLAWVIWRDKPHPEKKPLLEINTVFTGMIMQFINPKLILSGITSLSTLVLPFYTSPGILAGFILFQSLVGLACVCLWALFGSVFQRFFQKYGKISNAVFALLLVYCAYTILFH